MTTTAKLPLYSEIAAIAARAGVEVNPEAVKGVYQCAAKYAATGAKPSARTVLGWTDAQRTLFNACAAIIDGNRGAHPACVVVAA